MASSGGGGLKLPSEPPTGTPVSSEDLQGREELVGKRFLLVQGGPKPKINRVSDWQWKAGVIRCASHSDHKDSELQVRKKCLLCKSKVKRVYSIFELSTNVEYIQSHLAQKIL